MSNDHVAEPLRSILNSISANHRTAHAELRDGMAALKRAVLGSEPAENTRIILEKCPWPNAEPKYLWNCYFENREDDLTTIGATPVEALAAFLSALEETG